MDKKKITYNSYVGEHDLGKMYSLLKDELSLSKPDLNSEHYHTALNKEFDKDIREAYNWELYIQNSLVIFFEGFSGIGEVSNGKPASLQDYINYKHLRMLKITLLNPSEEAKECLERIVEQTKTPHPGNRSGLKSKYGHWVDSRNPAVQRMLEEEILFPSDKK